MVTISSALSDAERRLKAISDAPQLDAERLLLFVLKRAETSWLHAHSDEILTASQAGSFEKLLDHRIEGKPLAYLLGQAEFYGRTFLVNEDVLVPRPETEQLVDEALKVIAERRPRVIADVGTGSGIIAVTLGLELRSMNYELRIVASDISAAALEVARVNAERHGVIDMITCVEGDFLKPLERYGVDLIVSNPPYLPAEALAKAGCSRDTKGLTFEPQLALGGGSDGLAFVTKIQQQPIPAVYESLGGTIHRHNC